MPLLPSLDHQLRTAREEAGEAFIWAHIDTCLSCYLNDHHNRDGELLIGIHIDGDSTIGEVIDGLRSEFSDYGWSMGETREGFDYEAGKAAIDRLHEENADRLDLAFDSSLDPRNEEDDDGESVQAWFLLSWEVPESD